MVMLTVWTVACSTPVRVGLDARVTADAGPSGGAIGEACTSGSQCASSICSEVAPGRSVCSEPCESDVDCPPGVSWTCPFSDGAPTRACVCAATAANEVCGDGLDNDCNGTIDDCRVCAGVEVPVDSREHCGECGRACRADQECQRGECLCPPGSTECAGACVDVENDASHCGSCDTACPRGARCEAGACGCSAGAPDVCGGECVDLASDERHCGSCDRACDAGLACIDGECTCDSPGRTLPCGGGCVDAMTDDANCGACGNACPAAQDCGGGVCACPVPGQALCDGECADTSIDARHCGGCGVRCARGERCSGGICRCDSALECAGACVAPGDPSHCGACDRACRPDQRCVGAACRCAAAGAIECDGACVDPYSDSRHCGGCGLACGPGQTCSGGTCVCALASTTHCGTVGCVDTRTDRSHCGACDHECPAAQLCTAGACACPTSGQTYCLALDACVDLQSNAANCGSCGNACPTGTTCQLGACRCPVSGETFCASVGACVSLWTDELHCGACDRACPGATSCVSGTCRCDTTGLTLCGTNCVHLPTDESHCGSCGTACSPTRTCTGGTCWCAPPTAGSEMRLTTTLQTVREMQIAASSARAAIAWIEDGGSSLPSEARFLLLAPDGARALASDVVLATVPAGRRISSIDVAWSGSVWGVAWSEQQTGGLERVFFQRVAADGTPLGSPIAVGSDASGWDDIALAHSSTLGFVLAECTSSSEDTWFWTLGADASGPLPLATRIRLSSSASLSLSTEPSGASALVRGATVQPVDADGAVTRPNVFVSTIGRLYDLAWDGAGWATTTVTHQSGVGYRTSLVRGPALDLALSLRAPQSYNGTLSSLSIMGDDALVVSTVFPDGSASSIGTIELTRAQIPTSVARAATLRSPAVRMGSVATVSRSMPVAASHVGSDRLVMVWADARWGQLELYSMGADVPRCE